ncbi:MAG: transcriptional regulator [Clostridia bacterium]|nr:transcriptional regulator [Clostridia bacterium]
MNSRQIAEKIFYELAKEKGPSLREDSQEFSRGEKGVLLYLSKSNGLTAGELSEKLGVTTARIASLLNTLENKGLIIRNKDIQDKRKVQVYITDSGKDLLEEQRENLIRIIEKIIDEMGEKDINQYIELGRKIRDILNKM